YTLQRDLVEKGYHCDVVAPTSIPSPRGKQVKTDRIDAAQLVQFYANDLLTLVAIPEPEQEQDRDLIRSRQKLLEQQTELRKHIQALLRRNGRHYKVETQNKSHWTLRHYCWLEKTIEASSGSLKVNLELLVRQLKGINSILTEYAQQIEPKKISCPCQVQKLALNFLVGGSGCHVEKSADTATALPADP
ncbi:MAG: transposase, partial [Gammaproteobacteria bacterium]|nr:transposase [Gammaproteobacteria bacterium]